MLIGCAVNSANLTSFKYVRLSKHHLIVEFGKLKFSGGSMHETIPEC